MIKIVFRAAKPSSRSRSAAIFQPIWRSCCGSSRSDSTELYERVGDLVAFDLVNEHFRLLQEIIASESGAVVKTVGDAVMATFETPTAPLPLRSACARR
jgi:Adenylate and Guanylate cyclase catalytic domain